VRYPLTTGGAAQILGVIEPQLSETVRRGKVRPEPIVIAGRRQWCAEHLCQAADALDILTDELRARIEREAPSIASTAIGFVCEEVAHGSK
jgi:hypothetical protein